MDRNRYFEEAFHYSRFPATRIPLGENGEGMSLLTAFNVGDIVPLMAEPVLPNDKWDVNLSFLLRMFTPLHQIFSNIYLDTYVFWVNNRLNWTHWMQFCGQNDNEAYTLSFEYTIPKSRFEFSFSSGEDWTGVTGYVKSFGSYLGINPTVVTSNSARADVNDYFRRDYLNIYNEWFRDESIIDPILYSKGDTPEDNPVFTYASPLLKAAKLHDYFTDCLPEPMKGDDPIIGGNMPVLVGEDHDVFSGKYLHLRAAETDGGYTVGDIVPGDLKVSPSGNVVATGTSSGSGVALAPSNLIAKVGITIDDIRRASVVKHVLETLTASGTRYPEFLKGLWDASSPEVVLQIPEYVAGRRWRINISEVVSNSNTVSQDGASGSPIGATGAMSKTGASGKLFRKAFSEYGHLYVLGVIRIKQTYFQGIDRKFTDDSFWDLPLPQLSGLGFQPRYKRELKANGPTPTDADYDAVFGYGPSFGHYRRFPDKAVGIMRPDGALGLRHWNASEIYGSTVALNKEFIEQPEAGLDRCIAVPSTVRGSFQFYGEFLFTGSVTRTLPGQLPGIKRL